MLENFIKFQIFCFFKKFQNYKIKKKKIKVQNLKQNFLKFRFFFLEIQNCHKISKLSKIS